MRPTRTAAFITSPIASAGLNPQTETSFTNEKKAEIIDDIEAELRAAGRLEIKSKDLGDIVLEHLRGLDDVAYIRFASVYKDFQTVEEFREALEGLQ